MNSEIGELWRVAVDRYEQNTGTKIKLFPPATSVDDILDTVKGKEKSFRFHRHNASGFDEFRTLLAKAMQRIDKVSKVVAQPVSQVSVLSRVVTSKIIVDDIVEKAMPCAAVIFIGWSFLISVCHLTSLLDHSNSP
jgi:fungal STAND N-terminal Goodbye domain